MMLPEKNLRWAPLRPPSSRPLTVTPHHHNHSQKPAPITAEQTSSLAVTNHFYQTFAIPTNQNSPASTHSVNEALELHYCSDSDEESPCPRHINELALKTAKAQEAVKRKEESRDKNGGQAADNKQRKIPSIVVKPTTQRVSYKDALLKPRIFKPRFPKDKSHRGEQVWHYETKRQAQRRTTATVWSRLGER